MKRVNKKLGISAETVRVISGKELAEVQGGWPSELPRSHDGTCSANCTYGGSAGSIYECVTARCRTL